MPGWSEILAELSAGANPDELRRKYLVAYAAKVERDVILYASGWLQNPKADSHAISVNDEDVQGLMEAMKGLSGESLDLIIHSPGGGIASAEAFVEYLRSRYEHIRAIVPLMALSAGTIIACGCDEIVMGKHSFLSPIDSQVPFPSKFGYRMVAAQAILSQFTKAIDDIKGDPALLQVWYPVLEQYAPDVLSMAENASKWTPTLTRNWLSGHMFKGMPNADALADEVSQKLASHEDHMSHDRRISRARAVDFGLKVKFLEENQDEQDALLSVFHATTHTFTMTSAIKIIESFLGRAFIKLEARQIVMAPQ